MKVKTEDEFLHFSHPDDPLWWENYHFNGYDSINKVGIGIYVGIKPVLGLKEELVTLHSENPFFFRDQKKLEGELPLVNGSLKIEPLKLLKKWRICIRDSFQRIENGNLSNDTKEVEIDLCFNPNASAHGFSTNRGDRYEQPGFLEGEVAIGDKFIHLRGNGIRDHSWEIRNVLGWGEWYWFMGGFKSGDVMSFTYMRVGDSKFCHGWLRTNQYHEIRDIHLDPKFSGGVLKECLMEIETARERLEMSSQPMSFVLIPLGEEFGKSTQKVTETLVRLNRSEGYGFMWYGRQMSISL